MSELLSEAELAVLLIEECAEVQHAVTKCLRFGFDRDEPGYGNNRTVLSEEIGDLLGVIDRLDYLGLLDRDAMQMKRAAKIAKAQMVKDRIAAESKP